ncbi:MAG: hypothetical protein IIV92_07985 [Schwartzia sp.]|nr:hypothetical protein [Schwartzia sp. (in: firmicutes)]
MLALVAKRGNISAVHNAIKQSPADWLMWSTVGFGLFISLGRLSRHRRYRHRYDRQQPFIG